MAPYRGQVRPSPVVVIVSRTPEDQSYLLNLISNSDMHGVCADSCRSALAAASDIGASTVICDELLPWRDLLSYFAQSKSPPRVVVIACTPSTSLEAEVMQLGGFDVLHKPFEASAVLRVIHSATTPLH